MIPPLMMVLAVVGTWMVLGWPEVPSLSWPKILLEVSKRILMYCVLFIVLVAIYVGVVVPWLSF